MNESKYIFFCCWLGCFFFFNFFLFGDLRTNFPARHRVLGACSESFKMQIARSSGRRRRRRRAACLPPCPWRSQRRAPPGGYPGPCAAAGRSGGPGPRRGGGLGGWDAAAGGDAALPTAARGSATRPSRGTNPGSGRGGGWLPAPPLRATRPRGRKRVPGSEPRGGGGGVRHDPPGAQLMANSAPPSPPATALPLPGSSAEPGQRRHRYFEQ